MEVILALFLASLAVFCGWLIFRLNMIYERKKLINSLEAFLNTVKYWFASSYSEDINKNTWFDPSRSVYKVDFSIIPNIINSNLIKNELSEQLTYLVQLIDRFNQRVDQFSNYVFSDIDLYRKSIEIYREKDFNNKNYIDCYNEIDKLKKEIEVKS